MYENMYHSAVLTWSQNINGAVHNFAHMLINV